MDGTAVDPEERVEHLDEHECWRRLLANQVGRIAFMSEDRIEIVPINYVVRDRRLVMRTSPHTPLIWTRHHAVPFEVDGWDRTTAWSVIARGDVERSDDPGALALEREIGLAPWAPDERGPRDALAVLTVHELTGRAFHRRVDEQARWFW
ncbi:pyridoxamine 5'-phosphate oxidase family protein [Amnibacterium kyonggiense]|uniref:Pyridoxamine 5'-phosphate oxidase-like protein n=1 Tax=Amnibacterium kyonggiense TaxID=595671 RepID=A0A4R7FKF1_9MICO|nr:pyridoxamine 5'-phosphate oxidase family protein [Amnibacterium kyonggiense]TDS76832.1 pyridoxamine 5'-phosphate oxidase-like protein [Amnibacterium kyonggiense]